MAYEFTVSPIHSIDGSDSVVSLNNCPVVLLNKLPSILIPVLTEVVVLHQLDLLSIFPVTPNYVSAGHRMENHLSPQEEPKVSGKNIFPKKT